MARADARMIAEELHRLMLKDNEIKDAYLTKEEASEIYKVPVSHFNNYGFKYPRVKIGKSYKYSQNGLNKFLRS